MTITDSRTANAPPPPKLRAPSGSSSLNGQVLIAAHMTNAVEGQDSPQATDGPTPNRIAPAGSTAAPPATVQPTPNAGSPEGRETSQDQKENDTHAGGVLADDIPGRQLYIDAQVGDAAGEQDPPAQAKGRSTPRCPPPGLADPLLALAADVLDDLERVRIANENRLRQLTRDQADSDGLERGFGLDESHPDVARLAALVAMLAEAEHKATLNLQRLMRRHPLGPWVSATVGIGEKQGARLIAAIGDPYWNDLHQRPRTVSELWAYCGYHVIPAGVHAAPGAHASSAAGGELNGSGPGQASPDTQDRHAGVAPKRQRGQRANWSAAAKMRAYLVAESCIKQSRSPYRPVYDQARAKYADAVHAAACVRCGPKNNPAEPGSPLSEGHKHARALRAVAKEILRDLWREARDISHPEAS